MRRLIALSSLLAATIALTACGSNNNTPTGSNNAALQGQYFFHEQVYDYLAGTAAVAPLNTPGRSTHIYHDLGTVGHSAMGLSRMTPHKSLIKGVHPDQGDINSPAAWGELVGSVTVDGQGNVTGGIMDLSQPTYEGYVTDTLTGAYSVASDNTFAMTIAGNSTGITFPLNGIVSGDVSEAGQPGGQFVEYSQFIDSNGFNVIEIGVGELELQDSSAFSQSTLNNNFVFGLQGQTCYLCSQPNQGDLYTAGVFNMNGSGNITNNSEGDVATEFATDNQIGITGSYTAPDSNGRLHATLATTNYNSGALPQGYVFYIINAQSFFILSTDQSTQSVAAPILFGPAGLQSGTFSNSSISGSYVVAENQEDLQNEINPDSFSDASIALLTASAGTLNGTGDINQAGNISASVPFNYGSYSVASNGRVSLSGTTPYGALAPVFWLQSATQGYGIDQLYGASTQQEPGLLYLFQQSGSPFSNTSFCKLRRANRRHRLPQRRQLYRHQLGGQPQWRRNRLLQRQLLHRHQRSRHRHRNQQQHLRKRSLLCCLTVVLHQHGRHQRRLGAHPAIPPLLWRGCIQRQALPTVSVHPSQHHREGPRAPPFSCSRLPPFPAPRVFSYPL
jgi:hypothetical protein